MGAALFRRHFLIWTLLFAGAILLGGRAPRAQGLPVDLELILAIDCSGSVDEVEAQ